MAQHRGDDDACHHVGERPKLEERERWVLPKYRNHGRGDDDDVEGEGWVVRETLVCIKKTAMRVDEREKFV